MYLDALEFLEEERDAFRPYEALDGLTDARLSIPVGAAHDWSGRDLMGHIIGGLERSLTIARELAMGETSPALARWEAEWDAGGDAVNERLLHEWAVLPLSEVRDRFRTVPGELRGTLTVVPEIRWLKHRTHMASFMDETIDHYVAHEADLTAILAAAKGASEPA